jgi:hypothetical protein
MTVYSWEGKQVAAKNIEWVGEIEPSVQPTGTLYWFSFGTISGNNFTSARFESEEEAEAIKNAILELMGD